MKSIRAVLLTLSATVSLAVLPSCDALVALLNDPAFVEALAGAGGGGSASSSEKYYDSEGYPIFGYDGAYPVYGYDPSGNPIYDMTQLDSTSTVPDYPPLSDTTTTDTTATDMTATGTTTTDTTTTDTTATDTTAGDSSVARPSGRGYKGQFWGRSSRRASAPPSYARHGYGSKLTRRRMHGARRIEHGAPPRKFAPGAGKPDLREKDRERRGMEDKKFPGFKPGFHSKAGKFEHGKDFKPGKPRGKSRDDDETDKKKRKSFR